VTGYDLEGPRLADRSLIPVILSSSDGGNNWKRSEQAADGVGALLFGPVGAEGTPYIVPSMNGSRIVFGVGGSEAKTSGLGVIRSTDDGATWKRVLDVPALRSSSWERLFRFSPAFADDGVALVTRDGALYQSQDFGTTWTQTTPIVGQRVQQIEFSPAFASDHTMVAATVTGAFPRPGMESGDPKLPHNESSAGVTVSRDGGETWQLSSAGLAIDGIPYRYVEQVAVSPSFEQDGLLFAFAWGPWAAEAIPAALFRSSDRGQTWSPVWQSPVGKDGVRWYATFALSPRFGADAIGQIALFGLNSWSVSPHSTAPCQVYGTADSGLSWALVPRENDRAPGCTNLQVFAGGPTGRIWYTLRYPGDGRRQEAFRSIDDGKTWEFMIPPERIFPGGGYWPYTITPGGAFMVGTSDGVWMLPPPPASPASSL
jgi:photosystem II stability/assembly factor-like uncharacterized protein